MPNRATSHFYYVPGTPCAACYVLAGMLAMLVTGGAAASTGGHDLFGAVGELDVIDDDFDDDDLDFNENGTGSGFDSFVQSEAASVTEMDGVAVLESSSFVISQMSSKDTFDFFDDLGLEDLATSVSWVIAGSSFGPSGANRRYLSVVAEDFPMFDQRLNPIDTDAPGVYVRLADDSIGGFQGGLIVEDGTGARDELASWAWDGVWDGSQDLTIRLDLDEVGFTLQAHGNLGSISHGGDWSEIVNATEFTDAWGSRSARVAVLNQGHPESGDLKIDTITVPEPTARSLQLTVLLATLCVGSLRGSAVSDP